MTLSLLGLRHKKQTHKHTDIPTLDFGTRQTKIFLESPHPTLDWGTEKIMVFLLTPTPSWIDAQEKLCMCNATIQHWIGAHRKPQCFYNDPIPPWTEAQEADTQTHGHSHLGLGRKKNHDFCCGALIPPKTWAQKK